MFGETCRKIEINLSSSESEIDYSETKITQLMIVVLFWPAVKEFFVVDFHKQVIHLFLYSKEYNS